MNQSKERLRGELRQRRQALSLGRGAQLSESICTRAASLEEFIHARSVGLYQATDHEADPHILIELAHNIGKQVYLPVVNKVQRTLTFIRFGQGSALVKGAYGILEPSRRGECRDEIQRPLLDLLFVPLVGFDAGGYRLGFGGGYYDRFLADHSPGANQPSPCLVGLGFSFQEVERLPREPHDIALHLVVTETGVIRFI